MYPQKIALFGSFYVYNSIPSCMKIAHGIINKELSSVKNNLYLICFWISSDSYQSMAIFRLGAQRLLHTDMRADAGAIHESPLRIGILAVGTLFPAQRHGKSVGAQQLD
jgi:hypothetical protein